MRFLFVTPRLHTNFVPWARLLREHGHEVTFHVVVEEPGEEHGGARVVRPRLSPLYQRWERGVDPSLRHDFRARRAWFHEPSYRRLHGDQRFDVVVARDPTRPFAMQAALRARLSGARLVFYTQGPVRSNHPLWKRGLRAAGLAALRATWMSPVEGDRSRPREHPHFHWVPFARMPAATPKGSWFEGGRTRLLTVGKFVPRKNHGLLLRVVDRLRARHAVHLTILGQCWTEAHAAHLCDLQREVRSRGLDEHVTFRPNMSHDAVMCAYRHADVFVLPSSREPASVSQLEAMGEGLPVVVSDDNGTKDYVVSGRNGVHVRAGDETQLFEALDALLGEPERIRRWGTASHALVRERHHPDVVYRHWLEVIRDR